MLQITFLDDEGRGYVSDSYVKGCMKEIKIKFRCKAELKRKGAGGMVTFET